MNNSCNYKNRVADCYQGYQGNCPPRLHRKADGSGLSNDGAQWPGKSVRYGINNITPMQPV
jgi:hypothetical protein